MGKFIIKIVILLFIFFINIPVSQAANIIEKIDEYIKPLIKMKNFSGVILISKSGKILVNKGYGMSNYELNIANTPQTKFRIGSISKPITAIAIMQLQEKGLLSLNEHINRYIPDFPQGNNISIENLLTHTSGVPSCDEYLVNILSPVSLQKIIADNKNKPLDFEPGKEYKYSNFGYILLSYIIEKVSGKSYEEFIQENIFYPLNMINSGLDHNSQVILNRAAGYENKNEKLNNAPYIDMSCCSGAGSLYSTAEDLFLLDQALYSSKILNKESIYKMFIPFKNNYGYGWQIDKLFEHKVVYHKGDINGFKTNFSRFIDDKVCIIVLSNIYENFISEKISKDLSAILFGEKYKISKVRNIINLSSKVFDSYLGVYEIKPGFTITITKDENKLFAETTGQLKLEIFPESETSFFIKVLDTEIKFLKDKNGKVKGIDFIQNEKVNFFRKIN